MTDPRITEIDILRSSDTSGDMASMVNIVLAANDCGSLEELAERAPEALDDLVETCQMVFDQLPPEDV